MKSISTLQLFPRAARTLLLMVAITLTALTAGAEEYTITYDLNGGYATDDYKTSYESGENFYISIYPYKPGYTFTGFTWEGQATPVKAPEFSVTSNMILTAHFTPNNTDKGLWCDYRDETWGSDYATKNEFTISTAAQLAQFAHMVNTLGSGYKSSRYSFSGKTVTLTANIDLSAHEWVAIGYDNEVSNEIFRADFCGTFNGDGHTISGLYINQPGLTHQGLIGSSIDATIKNVILSNSTISGDGSVGGIAGDFNNGTIQDCHVLSDVTIKGRGAKVGAIVGQLGQSGGQWGAATGCSSAATLIYEGAGGVAGDISGGGLLEDCFYYGPDMNYGIVGSFAKTGITHCFYTAAYSGFPNAVDSKEKAARVYSVTAGEGVAISRSGEPTATYYDGKLKFYGDDGCSFDGTEYYTQGTTLTVTPTAAYEGYHLNYNVEGTGASLNEGTLTVGTADVTVSAVKGTPIDYTITYNLDGGTASNPLTYTIETETFTLSNPIKAGYTFTGWSGTGLEGAANMTVTIAKGSTGERSYTAHWTSATGDTNGDWNGHAATSFTTIDYDSKTLSIASEAEMALLSKDASTYADYIVTLTADINLKDYFWTPIAGFNGTFDGQGHTISGVMINSTAENQGLFGVFGKSANVSNLVIANSYISGGNNTGAVVGATDGTSEDASLIENCHVMESVTITGTEGANYGGIAGYSGGSIIACSSAAMMSASGNNTAGIVGAGYEIDQCLYYGTILPSDRGGTVWAIADGSVGCTNYQTYDATSSSHKYVRVYDADPGIMGTVTKTYADTGYKVYEKGVSYGGKFYTAVVALTEDGITDLTAYAGKTIDVAFKRSFTADKPSTVCLPFAYTPQGEEKFYSFTGINEDGGNYTADMTEVVSPLVANTPYLFMPTGDADFSGTYAIPASITAGSTISGDWTFKGTYSTIEWTDAPADPTYGFSAQAANDGIQQGQFVKVGSYVRIKPMRAYLQYNGSDSQFANARSLTRAAATTSDDTLPETIGVRLISANGEVTAIGTLYTRTGEVSFDSETWYTLDGKRLNAKPNTKGIYVNNGKKVVIK